MSPRLILLLALTGSAALPLAGQVDRRQPQLVVHIAVDQLRPDYLERWQSQFTGGLATLMTQGVVFLAGEQNHAVTQTAPGHASMMSGRWPYSTGIVANDRGASDADYPLVGRDGGGASPRRFMGTTLYDWMRAADSSVRVLSVSRKDRGAILPVGRARGEVFWFDAGGFTTSRWYASRLPAWVTTWNARDPITALQGRVWTPLPGIDYPEVDARPFERGGKNNTFPYPLPDDRARRISEVTDRPVMDSLTLDFAWAGVRAMQLGQAGHPDFLAVSLSTTDAIGHRYGPGSLEIHDQILRLDRQLGWFLDSLRAVIPEGQLVVSLTADHGSTEYPEAGGGERFSLGTEVRELRDWARDRWNIDIGIEAQSGLVLADTAALAARGVAIDSLANALRDRVAPRRGVRDIFTPASLATRSDTEAELWRHQIPPGTGWLVGVAIEPGWLHGSGTSSTGHGSTNLTDRRVPIIIMAPGLPPRRIARPVDVVDLAPTIAALIGVTPTEPLDGEIIPEVISSRR